MRVVIIGAGTLAYHLTAALLKNTVNIVQIFSRTLESAEEIASNYNIKYTDKISELEKADLYIVCANSDMIAEISYYIPFENCLVVHASGSEPISALKGKYRKGVIYPAFSFEKGKSLPSYQDIPFFIEAENKEDEEKLVSLMKRVSDEVSVVTEEQRYKVDMSVIFASSFVNHLYYLGGEIAKEVGIEPDFLEPVIKAAADRISNGATPYEAQRVNIRYKEDKSIQLHKDLLKGKTRLEELYHLFTESIQQTYSKDEE